MQSWTRMQRGYGILILRNLQISTGQSPGQAAPALKSALFSRRLDQRPPDIHLTSALIRWLRDQAGKKCHSSQSLLHSCSPRIYYLQEYFSSRATSVLAVVLYCWQRVWWELAPFEADLFPKGYRNKQQQEINKHALSYAFSYSKSLRLPESARDPGEFNEKEHSCAVK